MNDSFYAHAGTDDKISELVGALSVAPATELSALSAHWILGWAQDHRGWWVAPDGVSAGYRGLISDSSPNLPEWDPAGELSCAFYAANAVGRTWALVRHLQPPIGYAVSFPDVPGLPPPKPQLSPARALTEAAIAATLRLLHLGRGRG